MSEIYHIKHLDSGRYTDWQSVFDSLNRNSVYIMSELPTQAQQDEATRVFLLWRLALHWVIKLKWKSNYRIPYCPKVAKVMQPFGALLSHYVELCIQCHSFLPDNPYPSAANWFWEFANKSRNNNIFNPTDAKGKTKYLAAKRKIINSIAEGDNPICKETAFHEWRLIQTALHFKKDSNFDRQYLKPFIRAYRHWLTSSDSADWNAVLRENDKLYIQSGKGKGKITLSFDKYNLNQQ